MSSQYCCQVRTLCVSWVMARDLHSLVWSPWVRSGGTPGETQGTGLNSFCPTLKPKTHLNMYTQFHSQPGAGLLRVCAVEMTPKSRTRESLCLRLVPECQSISITAKKGLPLQEPSAQRYPKWRAEPSQPVTTHSQSELSDLLKQSSCAVVLEHPCSASKWWTSLTQKLWEASYHAFYSVAAENSSD